MDEYPNDGVENNGDDEKDLVKWWRSNESNINGLGGKKNDVGFGFVVVEVVAGKGVGIVGWLIFFGAGGGDELGGAKRFNDFLPSVGEFDFRCFNVMDKFDEFDNSLPILLHACAIKTSGFSFFGELGSLYTKRESQTKSKERKYVLVTVGLIYSP